MNRTLALAAVLFSGALLTTLSVIPAWNFSERNTRIATDQFAAQHLMRVHQNLQSSIQTVQMLTDFADIFEKIEQESFSEYVMPALKRIHGLNAIAWAPLVTNDARKKSEDKSLDRQAVPILEKNHHGFLIHSAKRPYYFPVRFLASVKQSEIKLGLDLATAEGFGATLKSNGQAGPQLLQDKLYLLPLGEPQRAAAILLPVYKTLVSADSRAEKQLLGFMVAIQSIAALSENTQTAFKETPDRDVERWQTFILSDEQASGRVEPELLRGKDSSHCYSKAFVFSAVSGTMTTCPPKGEAGALANLSWRSYFSSPEKFFVWFLAGGGTLATILMAVFVHVLLTIQGNIQNKITLSRQELEQTRDEAERAGRAKDEFFAMLSHEIRTPLNGVLGVLSILKDTKLNIEQLDYVETGINSGNTLLRIINDILDYSKIEAGKLDLEITPFEVGDIINDAIGVISPRAVEKGLKLHAQLPEDGPVYVKGDSERLRQVLINLAGNAVKFTDKGNVTLRVTPDRTSGERIAIKFEVIDTGIGIPEDRQKDLFMKFKTLSPSYQRKEGGTGLGLAICKKIVEMMGGKIGVTSPPNGGTKFWFIVELELSNEMDNAQKHMRKDGDNNIEKSALARERYRILMAEDNPTNSMVARIMLEKAGYRLDIVGNGAEAVDAIRDFPYDIILMDIGMPVMNGTEAAAKIRELPGEKSETPIIALTAHALKTDRVKNLLAGMDDYLSKPVKKEDLVGILDYWLDKRQPRASEDQRSDTLMTA